MIDIIYIYDIYIYIRYIYILWIYYESISELLEIQFSFGQNTERAYRAFRLVSGD